ncbi:MAG: ribokinase [Clostridia bacterium]|nr:ribokinase [Clostridia bacterium]
MNNRVLVISSANMDFVMKMNTLPAAGQTVIDPNGYCYVPGGKGANSAVAFKRLGGDCVFCCKLGRDSNGALLRHVYEKEGMDTRFIATDDENPTGLAAIMVESDGANRIVVYPGSNATLNEDDIDAALTSYPDALYLQLEISHSAVIYAANAAARKGIPIFMDAGPADPNFPLEQLPRLEVFSPNETECEIFTGITPDTPEKCLRASLELLKRVDAKYIVLKLGGRGCFVCDGNYYYCVPSYDTTVVDTTAAGDAFTAGLVLHYLKNGDMVKAAQYGNVVGAITVSRAGASTSIPSEAEVAKFIERNDISFS